MGGFISQFNFANLLANIVWAVIIALLGRATMYVLGKAPAREKWYWLCVPALLFGIIMLISTMFGQEKTPALAVSLEDVSTGQFNDQDGTPVADASIIASIKNTGAPSVADAFRFSVRLPSGRLLFGQLMKIPEVQTVCYIDGTSEEVYGSDDLITRTSPAPIPRGARVRGRLLFKFADAVLSTIQTPGSTLELSVLDAWGHWASASMKNNSGPRPTTKEMFEWPSIRSRRDFSKTRKECTIETPPKPLP